MKANELMIGDWVMPLKKKLRGIPGRVVTIEGGTNVCWIDSKDYSYLVPCSDVERIPLTPEILEKNGFECRGPWCLPGEDLGLRKDGDSWGLLSYYAEYGALAFCHIRYVHELQHALRLCGIDKTIEL